MTTTRRDFIVSACKLCAVLGTVGVSSILLEGCKSLKVLSVTSNQDGKLEVPLSSFSEHSQIIIRSKKMEFDIFVNKKSETQFTAILMKCSHESQPLTAGGTSLNCASHGSKFDLEGNVLLEPATRKLTTYAALVSGQMLLIELKAL